jgi:hypothetical protein
MPIGEITSPPVPVARKMIWVEAPPPPSPEVWARYRELLELERPSVGQQREFTELCGRLNKTEAMTKLDAAIIPEVDRLEELVRGEAEAEAEEIVAVRVEMEARAKVRGEIHRLQQALDTNDLPEIKRRDRAREAVRAIQFAKEHVGFLYQRWPELFGLPFNENPPPIYVTSLAPSLRVAVEAAGLKVVS